MRLLPIFVLILLFALIPATEAQSVGISSESQQALDEALDMVFKAVLALNSVFLLATVIGIYRSIKGR